MSRTGRSIAAVLAFGAVLAVGPAQAEQRVEVPVGRYSTVDAYVATGVDERFLAATRYMNRGTLLSAGDDGDLIYSAKSFCDGEANGKVLDEMSDDLIWDRFGMGRLDLRAMLRAMSTYYCPQYLGNVG